MNEKKTRCYVSNGRFWSAHKYISTNENCAGEKTYITLYWAWAWTFYFLFVDLVWHCRFGDKWSVEKEMYKKN